MRKLIGPKKVKTAVFISGTGSNLKNLIKFSKTKKSPILIDLIISSTNKARGLMYADRFDIKKKIVCLLYTSPSPRDVRSSRMPSSA